MKYENIFNLLLTMGYVVCYNSLEMTEQKTEVQIKITQLREKGWTLINIGRALSQSSVTIEAWNAGTRSPANLQSVLTSLDQLAKRKRIPKKRQSTKLGEYNGNPG